MIGTPFSCEMTALLSGMLCNLVLGIGRITVLIVLSTADLYGER